MVEPPQSLPTDPCKTTSCANCSSTVSAPREADYNALYAEVQTLAKYVDCTRAEIASLSADGVVKSHVVAATDELDAIVCNTVNAATTILDACESIDNALVTQLVDVAGAATTKIYEACSFQDLTGQRVAKIVRILQLIDARITEILNVFGSTALTQPARYVTQAHDPLLAGPQKPGTAMDQGAVDALLDANG